VTLRKACEFISFDLLDWPRIDNAVSNMTGRNQIP
jgi:hypothetical protein